ncbi:MAG TPA: RpiB/LacA/LacB family sugar-phosphate isomerase [Clostridia bacterium]|nr:RpiB/LacA/LacB family sugar-phosphate isomerase [Clostridia bacterium]
MKEKIVIGSDKSGYTLKERLASWLIAQGYEVEDVGTKDIENFQPYFEVAPKAARKVQSGEAKRAILICGTGMGMCIAANKFKGVYAAVVESVYAARMSAVVNGANILTLGGWIIAPEMGEKIVEEWLNTPFGEGFPPERVAFLKNARAQVAASEEANFK